MPGHVHAALDGGDELGAAVDALDVGGVVEAVAGVPAELLYLLAELGGLGEEALGVYRVAEQLGEAGGGAEVLVEEAVEEEVGRRELGAAEGGGVVVVADGYVVAPDVEAVGTVVDAPGVVKAEDGVEARGQPGDIFCLVGDEEGELAEDGLGLVAARGVAVDEAPEGSALLTSRRMGRRPSGDW